MIDAQWRGAARLLAVRLDSLGDVLMTTPALRAFRESIPGCRITLLTSTSGAAAAAHVPEVDEAIVFAAPWMKSEASEDGFSMISALQERRFDAAVIFTVYSQSALPAAYLCHLAGIPLRLAHCRENPYRLLTHWVRDPEPGETVRHEVERQLALAAAVGFHPSTTKLSFRIPSACRERVEAMDLQTPVVVFHPGASAPSRRYPPERFAEAADLLRKRTGCQVVFTGEAAEAGLIESIRARMAGPSLSLSGALALGELGALIGRASLLVSNNTGPAHIAAALGTPVVDLYALTNPQHTPWRVPSRVLYHDVPCRNCYKSVCPEGHNDCLRRVEPAQVADAAVELLHR